MASSADASWEKEVDKVLEDADGSDVAGAGEAGTMTAADDAELFEPAEDLVYRSASDGSALAAVPSTTRSISAAFYLEKQQQSTSKTKSLAKANAAGANAIIPVPSSDSAVPVTADQAWVRDAEEQWARAAEEQSNVATSTLSLVPTTAAAARKPGALTMDLQTLEDAFDELLGASKALVEAVEKAHARFGVEYTGVDSESCGALSLKQCTTLDYPRHTSADSTLSAMDRKRVKAAVNRARGQWGEAHANVISAASAVRCCYELAAQEEKVRERAEAILEKCKPLVVEDEEFTAADDWSL